MVAQMADLSPTSRRLLLRYLRVSGLLVSEQLITDRNRLQKAPALGVAAAKRQQERHANAAVDSRPPIVPLRIAGKGSTSGGRAVLGAPDKNLQHSTPHRMAPLPGQAPEEPIGIIFQVSHRGNQGAGYGSYTLRWPGQAQQVVRLQFGSEISDNEAEYDTLISALEAVLKRLTSHDAASETARLEIVGNSLLVVNHVNGAFPCTEQHLAVRLDHVRSLLARFGDWRLTHQPWKESTRVQN